MRGTFGIELEGYGMTTEQIRSAVLSVEGTVFVDNSHTHHGPTFFDGVTWQVMADGSVRGPNNFELVSPVMKGARGMRMAAKVIKAMKRAGAQTNRSAGLHVTFGCNNSRWNRLGVAKKARVLRRLSEAYSYFKMNGIDSILAPSRRTGGYEGNQWAPDAYVSNRSTWTMETWESCVRNGHGFSKYEAVNLSKMHRSACIEFRQHQGTWNWQKVIQWIRLLDGFLAYSLNEEHADKTVGDYSTDVLGMMECLGLGEGARRFFVARAVELV